jgi:hypothetical protein
MARGAALDPDRYTVAWSYGTPRNAALAPWDRIARVSHGIHGAFMNEGNPLERSVAFSPVT